jgi:hypothetical protein
MKIGSPQRIYRVEPLKEPVPAKREPAVEPPKPPRSPKTVPAK